MEVDFYQIEEELTPEERRVRETVARFVQERFVPRVRDAFRAGTFPLDLVGEIAALGAFGADLKGYGCAGLNSVEYGLLMMELERGDSGLRSFGSVQGSLSMHAIHDFGSEEQKQKWLPGMAAGKLLGCFGLTEPDHGSDPSRMKTKAVKDGNRYVLNGSKTWITNGSIADIAVVWAKLDGKVRGFLVEKGTPGFEAKDIKGKLSLRASVTSELFLEDVAIPAENMLPASDGLRSPLKCLNHARYGIAWGAIGSAMATYTAALNYAKERFQFGKPIASFQLIQAKLVHMLVEITKAQLLCLRLGRLRDAGKATHLQISLAKMNNVSKALEIAREARDIMGANGISDEYPVMRHMVNLESVNTYEGTYNIHLLALGKEITGISSFE